MSLNHLRLHRCEDSVFRGDAVLMPRRQSFATLFGLKNDQRMGKV